MIFYTVNSSSHSTDPRLDRAADILRELIKCPPAPGHYPIEGEDFYYNVMRYDTTAREEKQLENHLRYTDIHAVICGTEAVDAVFSAVAQGALTRTKPYDAASDCEFFALSPDTVPTTFVLHPGELLALESGEFHRPGLSVGAGADTLKVVFKLIQPREC